jgi:hypothetical protein
MHRISHSKSIVDESMKHTLALLAAIVVAHSIAQSQIPLEPVPTPTPVPVEKFRQTLPQAVVDQLAQVFQFVDGKGGGDIYYVEIQRSKARNPDGSESPVWLIEVTLRDPDVMAEADPVAEE